MMFYILTFVVFGLYCARYANPYKLNMYIGSKGCGKSTFIAKTAVLWLKRGRTVYTTTPLAGCIYVPPEKIGHVFLKPDSILLVDISIHTPTKGSDMLASQMTCEEFMNI